MISLLRSTAAIVLTLILLLVTTRVVGITITPSSLSMLALHQCGLEPCWHDIRPGATTVGQAKQILASDHDLVANLGTYYDNCWYTAPLPSWKICLGPLQGRDQDVIAYIYIRFESAQEAPRLGDVLTLLGEPVASKLCWYRFGVGVNNSRSFIGADLYFGNGIYLGAYDPQRPDSTRPDPNMTLFLLSYAHRDLPQGIPSWRGFVADPNQEAC